MNAIRPLIVVTALSAILISAAATPAIAGGGPSTGPAQVTAPSGFAHAYLRQARLVKRTCWTYDADYDRAVARYHRSEVRLDHRLERRGFAPSPTYFDFSNADQLVDSKGRILATISCPKG